VDCPMETNASVATVMENRGIGNQGKGKKAWPKHIRRGGGPARRPVGERVDFRQRREAFHIKERQLTGGAP